MEKKEAIKLLLEKVGEQLEITILANISVDAIVNKINHHIEGIKDGFPYKFNCYVPATEKIREETKIERINVEINFTYSNTFSISGSFIKNNTK